MQKVEQKPKHGYKVVKNYFKKEFEIPSDWNYVKYKDVLTEVDDPIVFDDDAMYKLITARRRNGGLVLREILKGSEILTKNLFSVEKGDFIIAKMQIIHGSCGLVPASLVDAKISGSYIRFKSKKALNLEYLNWFSHTPLFYQQTFISSVGSNLEKMNFNKKHWLNHLTPVPPIDEQHKITSILFIVDSLIRQTQKIIEQSQKLKKGLMQKLLTKGIGHTRFKKVRFLFSSLMEIPIEWERKTVGELFKLRTGGTPSRTVSEYFQGDIPWVTSTDLNRGIITNTLEKISKDAIQKAHLKIFPKGTFLIATYGLEAAGTRGKCGILELDATINQACMAFLPSEHVLTEFLFYFYLHFGEKIDFNYAQGTKQQNLYPDTVKKIPILIPPKEEQRSIILILSNIDSEIRAHQQYKSQLETLKKGLLQKLLTGQIRVKV